MAGQACGLGGDTASRAGRPCRTGFSSGADVRGGLALLLVVAITRYISLGSILAAMIFPVAAYFVEHAKPPSVLAFPSQHFNGITSWAIDNKGEVRHVYV